MKAKKRTKRAAWWSEETGFFGPGYLKEYENILTKERTKAEVDFLAKALKLKRGAKILDCPCGHGRHAVELARRGYKVTGQDLNSFFLKEAKKTAKRARVSVRWIQGDMRDIPFQGEFDVVLNLYTAFGYLESDEEDEKALSEAAKALRPKGKFILELNNRERVIRTYHEKDWQQLSDGSIVITEKKFDQAAGRNVERRIRIWKNGKHEEFMLFIRMYTIAELVKMLRRAGLILKEMYGDYNGGPITFDSKRYILIAEKTGNK